MSQQGKQHEPVLTGNGSVCPAEGEPHTVEKMSHVLGNVACTMLQTSGATGPWHSRPVTQIAFTEKTQGLLLSRVMPCGNKLPFSQWVVSREFSRKEDYQETTAIIQV